MGADLERCTEALSYKFFHFRAGRQLGWCGWWVVPMPEPAACIIILDHGRMKEEGTQEALMVKERVSQLLSSDFYNPVLRYQRALIHL